MRRLALLLVLLLAIALRAPRAHAAGMNLAWNDCGSFGTCNQTFACDTNGPGPFTLVGSFVPPEGVTQFAGEEIVLDFLANDSALPDWWQFANAGTCRQTALSADADFVSGPDHCLDYWQGQGAGGIASWQVGSAIGETYPNNRARLKLAFSVRPDLVTALTPGSEYYAFRVHLSKTKTTGAGSCAGCSVPVAAVFSSCRLLQPADVGDVLLTQWQDWGFASWQNATYNVYDVGYSCPPVPAKNKTWGSIKSLYR